MLLSQSLHAHEDADQTEHTYVEGRRINLIGDALSASEGVIGQQEIAIRPLLRTGEILELVPGMVVTQHSGTGKANQYFLRGFNLDHGTDFSTKIDGMPINKRTHAHGQGYTDLNFVIPETIQRIDYRKGAYYAEVGDFSGAGSANMSTARGLDEGLLEITVGEDNYTRALAMDALHSNDTHWLYALELNRYDGPWTDISEDLKKTNLLLKRSANTPGGQLDISLMAYDNSWNSADQIPQRAVDRGLIDDYGSLDTTLGGESSRYSVNLQWKGERLKSAVYALKYKLNLWSNFTYFLDDEVNGDQFEQADDRTVYGLTSSYDFNSDQSDMQNTVGLELQHDAIDEVALYRSRERERLGTIRSDQVGETSLGVYWQNRWVVNSRVRTVFGIRYDAFEFDVTPLESENINGIDLRQNGGNTSDSLFSAKGNIIFTLSDNWESYISAGQGLHSNDARGTTINVDPADGSPVDAVDPLVRSTGYEAGLRAFVNDTFNASLALWALELDSELLFVGDAGTTEASRASERQGVELTSYYRISPSWTFDLEYAWTNAEFTEDGPEGNHIPGAFEQVVQSGLSLQMENGWFGNLRLRYFSGRPLIEDDSVRSEPSTLLNLRAGYAVSRWSFTADVFNLLDSKDHDIDYYYESRLADEVSGAGTEDIHFHVLEPRNVRVRATYHF